MNPQIQTVNPGPDADPDAGPGQSFSERLLIAAPPLVYQQRNVEEACTSRAMGTFLTKQLDLIINTHCFSPIDAAICPGLTLSLLPVVCAV